MADKKTFAPRALGGHGAAQVPSVVVDSYNLELRDPDGFIGDRASKRAFKAIIDAWRERLRKFGDDPLGEQSTEEIGKKTLDKMLVDGDTEAAGLIHSAVEDFAQELADVVSRFLRLKAWKDTQRLMVGGGLRQSRVGELAIGRAAVLLKGEKGHKVDLWPIRHHPDEAGLIGAAHLAPSWIFKGHDSILAVDIGGSNIRAGVVELNLEKAKDLSRAHIMDFELWRHRDDEPTREEAIDRLGSMLKDLAKRATKAGRKIAPVIGIGCPGIINDDGTIERGGQNLPGNWEGSKFNLPTEVNKRLPEIDGEETIVIVHNDAVVHGLSEIPFQTDVECWGVVTIGTGLGNARFTNRRPTNPEKAA
jgi:hypothetical protein